MMTHFKRWILTARPLDESDVTWIKGLGCDFSMQAKEPLKVMYGNQVHTFSNLRSNQIQVITTTDKQETMLKLKYGNEITLGSVIYVDELY